MNNRAPRQTKTALSKTLSNQCLLVAALTVAGCVGEANLAGEDVATNDMSGDSSEVFDDAAADQNNSDGTDGGLAVGPTWPAAGMTFATWDQGVYSGAASDESLANLADTGARWVSVIVTTYQWNITDTEIEAAEWTPDEADLRHVIQQAHGLGLSVMLKPHVDLLDDPDHWRGNIGLTFDESDWGTWFQSYSDMILGYAQIAESEGVALFCIGTELSATSHHSAEWRSLAAEVREIYRGQLVYAANHGGEEAAIDWWDELDLIGVDPYYGLTDIDQPTVEELKEGWAERALASCLRAQQSFQSSSRRWGGAYVPDGACSLAERTLCSTGLERSTSWGRTGVQKRGSADARSHRRRAGLGETSWPQGPHAALPSMLALGLVVTLRFGAVEGPGQ